MLVRQDCLGCQPAGTGIYSLISTLRYQVPFPEFRLSFQVGQQLARSVSIADQQAPCTAGRYLFWQYGGYWQPGRVSSVSTQQTDGRGRIMASLTFFAYFFLGLGPGIAFFIFFLSSKSFLVLLTFFR